MYAPIQIGIPRSHEDLVTYKEFAPSQTARDTVYCYWEFQAAKPFYEPFSYLVLPDGCIDLIFDMTQDPEYPGVLIMTPSTRAESVTIEPQFSYIGIRLQPGAWLAEPMEIVGKAGFYARIRDHDFTEDRRRLSCLTTITERVDALNTIADKLMADQITQPSPFIKALLSKHHVSVDDLIGASGYSRRQLQRILKESLGYSPHDFIKIIRFQEALRSGREAAMLYADQSHFIRECKRVTDLTPVQLRTNYQIMTDLSKPNEAERDMINV